jgi:putative iron-regulated protein
MSDLTTRRLKTWTALGLAALGTAGMAPSDGMSGQSAQMPVRMILAEADGEGGGEGGGSAASSESGEAESGTTYALGSTDPNAYLYDAKPQIEAYVELARASYARAASDAEVLGKAVDALLANPSEATLADARKAWVATRPAYLRTEVFRFYDGPIEKVEEEINAWPLNEAYLDYVQGSPSSGLINDPSAPLDEDALEGRNQKQDEADVTIGWHAIEFLLWGQDQSAEGPGNRPYTDYIAGQGNNDRRRAYLKIATENLLEELEKLRDSWADADDDGYATRFAKLPQREAIGRMVNGMAILAGYEMMSERMGVALDSGDQEDEQSCFSDTTKQDFVQDLAGIKQVWTGKADGAVRPGLDALVRRIDAPTADRVDALLADAEAKINALGEPWDKVLAAGKDSPERQAAEQAVASLQALSEGFVAAGNKLGVLVLVPNG